MRRQIVPKPKRNGPAEEGFMEELLGRLHNPVARMIVRILRAIRKAGISLQPDLLQDVNRYVAGPQRKIYKSAAMKLAEMEQQKPDTVMVIRQDDLAAVKESMERGLEKGFKYFGWNTEEGVLRSDSIYCIQSKEVAEDFCWYPDINSLPNRAIRLSQGYNVLIKALAQLAGGGESPAVVSIPLEGIEKVDPEQSRRQHNYNHLRKTLMEFGPWDGSISDRLVHGMVTNSYFQIALDALVYGEPVNIDLHFRENKLNNYAFTHFDISGIWIAHKEINGIDTNELEQRMKAVDFSMDNFNLSNLRNRYAVLRDLDLLENIPEAKSIIEQLYLKYMPQTSGFSLKEREDRILRHATRQTFPVRPDFPLTAEEACHLFAGRAVHLPVPGRNSQETAWFRLDPLQKDAGGNALLLQYAPHYNYNLPHILNELPLKTTEENPFVKLVLELYGGHFPAATLLLNDKETPVRLLADPLRRSVGVYTPEGRPFAPALAQAFIPAMPSIEKEPAYPYLYAYDSELKRQAYFPDLGEQQSADFNRKEAIMRSLNSPDPPGAGKGQKKQ